MKFREIAPSLAFVADPQANGVARRFNRTLKKQAICGHVFRNLEEVRRNFGEFLERYNGRWRPEKLGFRSPCEARWAHALKQAA